MNNNAIRSFKDPLPDDYPKKLVINLLFAFVILYIIRLACDDKYVLVQLFIDVVLIYLLYFNSNRLTWNLLIIRGLISIPILIIAALLVPSTSPISRTPQLKSIIVAIQEIAYSIPLLLLVIGKPRKTRRIISISIFIVLGVVPLVTILISVLVAYISR